MSKKYLALDSLTFRLTPFYNFLSREMNNHP